MLNDAPNYASREHTPPRTCKGSFQSLCASINTYMYLFHAVQKELLVSSVTVERKIQFQTEAAPFVDVFVLLRNSHLPMGSLWFPVGHLGFGNSGRWAFRANCQKCELDVDIRECPWKFMYFRC